MATFNEVRKDLPKYLRDHVESPGRHERRYECSQVVVLDIQVRKIRPIRIGLSTVGFAVFTDVPLSLPRRC
jgi:hypothetical protein